MNSAATKVHRPNAINANMCVQAIFDFWPRAKFCRTDKIIFIIEQTLLQFCFLLGRRMKVKFSRASERHDRVKNAELTSGQRANHDATCAETRQAQTNKAHLACNVCLWFDCKPTKQKTKQQTKRDTVEPVPPAPALLIFDNNVSAG